MAKLQGGNVPQCPIAGDANAVERQTQRVVQIKLHPWNLLPNIGDNFVKS